MYIYLSIQMMKTHYQILRHKKTSSDCLSHGFIPVVTQKLSQTVHKTLSLQQVTKRKRQKLFTIPQVGKQLFIIQVTNQPLTFKIFVGKIIPVNFYRKGRNYKHPQYSLHQPSN